MRIIYNVDDVMYGPDIVKWNRGKPCYIGDEVQDRAKQMMHMSDVVLTTTDKIKEYYC